MSKFTVAVKLVVELDPVEVSTQTTGLVLVLCFELHLQVKHVTHHICILLPVDYHSHIYLLMPLIGL